MTCCAEYQPCYPSEVRVGLDLGSREVKLAVMGPGGLLRQRLLEAVPFWLATRRRGGLSYQELGLDASWPVVATGYGRAVVPGIKGISEIRAHFRGALWQTGLRTFTLVELGGQDSKVIKVEKGRVLDFITNDRCAAGTGRYLENMASLLGVNFERLAGAENHPVEISSTCAIFGETEILARLAEGQKLENILAGVNNSVARRVAQMVRRFRPQRLVFCGGVAKNQAVVSLTSRATGCPVMVPAHPQFNGALGCCLEEVDLNEREEQG